jgi:hypothetical protein
MGPIVLFTDFGAAGPYVGQMHGVLQRLAPRVPVIDLMHDLPAWDVRAAAYLLPACVQPFGPDAVFVCVVDPGVGGDRAPLTVQADGRWYVGPDNGLFALLCRRAQVCQVFEIRWRPARLSGSFHGRDLFAPVAAQIAMGGMPELALTTLSGAGANWPDELDRVIYIDRYGNVMTGRRAETVSPDRSLWLAGVEIHPEKTFSAVRERALFWYENSSGLVEVAANQASAAGLLQVTVGDRADWQTAKD